MGMGYTSASRMAFVVIEPKYFQHPLKVIGKHMRIHPVLMLASVRQKVCVARPELERPEDMFGGSPAYCHRIRNLVDRRWTASRTDSCSHRAIRRSEFGLH
jgi:hypothetical protein